MLLAPVLALSLDILLTPVLLYAMHVPLDVLTVALLILTPVQPVLLAPIFQELIVYLVMPHV